MRIEKVSALLTPDRDIVLVAYDETGVAVRRPLLDGDVALGVALVEPDVDGVGLVRLASRVFLGRWDALAGATNADVWERLQIARAPRTDAQVAACTVLRELWRCEHATDRPNGAPVRCCSVAMSTVKDGPWLIGNMCHPHASWWRARLAKPSLWDVERQAADA